MGEVDRVHRISAAYGSPEKPHRVDAQARHKEQRHQQEDLLELHEEDAPEDEAPAESEEIDPQPANHIDLRA